MKACDLLIDELCKQGHLWLRTDCDVYTYLTYAPHHDKIPERFVGVALFMKKEEVRKGT